MAQAVPAHLIAKLLSEISDDTEIKPPDDTMHMAEIIASAKLVNRMTDDTSYTRPCRPLMPSTNKNAATTHLGGKTMLRSYIDGLYKHLEKVEKERELAKQQEEASLLLANFIQHSSDTLDIYGLVLPDMQQGVADLIDQQLGKVKHEQQEN